MSDGESVHSSAILSKVTTGGRRGLKLNKRTQNNIYFQVLMRTSLEKISIARKSPLKLVYFPSLKMIPRFEGAKSRNFTEVCMVGVTNFPSTRQTSGKFRDFTENLSHYVSTETHKGLKRVTLICLPCPMLVNIHFRKYHIWNEKKR